MNISKEVIHEKIRSGVRREGFLNLGGGGWNNFR